ncbi:MAG: DUF2807 domain-containing protein [Bacteroidetes bacterium]|nr:MAG: DUF2807 domain-containing protein [Bacteroidota bacterium]
MSFEPILLESINYFQPKNIATMKYRNAFFTILFASALMLSSCWKVDYFPCVSPRGANVKEERFTGYFDGINLRLPAKVYVNYGKEPSISVIAPENIQEYIETKSTGNTLVIDNSRCLKTTNNDIIIYVTMPDITFLRVAGSGNIIVDSFLYEESISAEVSGSGSIYLSGEFDRVYCSVSGSGKIDMTGSSYIQNSQISGSGRVDALDMVSELVDIKISGSGQAWVFATKRLDARISGSGKVYYKGNPAININISGSGNVIHL